ncbi:Putative membrane spanning protein [Giardia duodenalis]|uniref:Membrane protein n=2 Tax=Giardia intestinalis TaxID=5741 RepID=C6LU58_GIAIB|nr:Membrane protein [Giardia intestinalis ATCC 50581]ESU43564.1 Putative membrane spanning protein [Giardia intestinalis]
MQCNASCRCSRKFVLAVVLGQICAIGNSASGVFNDLLSGINVSVPFLQSMLFYGLLLFLWVLPSVHKFFVHRARDAGFFLLSGMLDITANSLAIMSFVYTSVGAVLLILCLSTPFSMILSLVITKTRFSWMQVMFSCFATGFAILFVVLDTLGDESKHRIPGDLLAMGAAFIYGLTSVINEFIIGSYTPVQFLARLSIGAFTLALILFLCLEMNNIQILATAQPWGYIVGYLVSLIVMYSVLPLVIKYGGAVVFNISLISCNVYGMLASLIIFKYKYVPWIAIPVLGIIGSLTGYFLSPSSSTCCRVTPVSTEAVPESGQQSKTSASSSV